MPETNPTRNRRIRPNLTGQRFGRWSVISEAERRGRNRAWNCVCDCGTARVVLQGNFRGQRPTKSCGCWRSDFMALRNETHGLTHTPLYGRWGGMVNRCYNENEPDFKTWGGRGITVCDRWRSFENFLADMGEIPFKDATLERIDNNGNYEPNNVRWAPQAEQALNRRSNHLVTFQGQTKPLVLWAREHGLTRSTLGRRLKKGWSVERALTSPLRVTNRSQPPKVE